MNQPLRLNRYANGRVTLPQDNALALAWVKDNVSVTDSLSARWNDGDHTRQRPADLLRKFGEDDEAFWLRMVTWLHANPANPFASLADAAPEAPAVAQVPIKNFDGVIPSAIRGYLCRCSSGGMSKKHIDIIQANVDEADRLGYFKLAIAETMLAAAPEAPAQAEQPPAQPFDPFAGFVAVRTKDTAYGPATAYVAAPAVAQVPDDDVAKAEWDGYQKGWQSAIGTLNKPATEQAQQDFTTGDNDLDALLNSAHWMREPGTGMDVGLTFIGALERIKARLAAAPEAPAQAPCSDCNGTGADGGVLHEDAIPCVMCQGTGKAAPSAGEVEQRVREFERLLEHLIDIDPDRAERFIESTLAQLALKKRLEEKRAAINQRKDKP